MHYHSNSFHSLSDRRGREHSRRPRSHRIHARSPRHPTHRSTHPVIHPDIPTPHSAEPLRFLSISLCPFSREDVSSFSFFFPSFCLPRPPPFPFPLLSSYYPSRTVGILLHFRRNPRWDGISYGVGYHRSRRSVIVGLIMEVTLTHLTSPVPPSPFRPFFSLALALGRSSLRSNPHGADHD